MSRRSARINKILPPLEDEERAQTRRHRDDSSSTSSGSGERHQGAADIEDSAARTFRAHSPPPIIHSLKRPADGAPPPPPPPPTRAPPPPSHADSSDDSVDFDEPRRRTFRKPAPIAAKQRKRVAFGDVTTRRFTDEDDVDDVEEDQYQRRTAARQKMKTIQQSGLRIPFYNDTRDRADKRDSERDVVIDQRAFKSLLEDKPDEYQDANKPPWAPRVPADKLAELMTWEAVEAFSEQELRSKDFYAMAMLVAGMAQVKASTFVTFVPAAAPALDDKGRPIQGGGGGDGELLREDNASTAGGGALAGFTPTTPIRDFMDQLRNLDPLPNLGAPVAPDAGRLPPQTQSQIDTLLLNEAQNVVFQAAPVPGFKQSGARAADDQFVQGGARSREFRQRAAARGPAKAPYVNSPNDVARLLNQQARALTSASRVWAGRAVATGVYYLSPSYTSARDKAYVYIKQRAPALKGVRLHYFMRQTNNTASAQYDVRLQFAVLIATLFNMNRHDANRSAKLAGDAKNYARTAEEVLRWFHLRITFDEASRTFFDSGRTNDDTMEPIKLPRGVYDFYDPHSPFPRPFLPNPRFAVSGLVVRTAPPWCN